MAKFSSIPIAMASRTLPFLLAFWILDSQIQCASAQLESGCGGAPSERSGAISYKLATVYENEETCVWILRQTVAGRGVQVKLDSADFADEGDFLEVYIYDSIYKEIRHGKGTNGYLRKVGDQVTHTIIDALIVVFKSDGTGTGKGFSFSYKATGFYPDPPVFLYGDFFSVHGESGLLERFDPFGFGAWSTSVWAIAPTRTTDTALTLYHINLSPYTSHPVQLYLGTSNNVTFLGEFLQKSAPVQVTVPTADSSDVIFIIFNNQYASTSKGPTAGIQAHWNLMSPPDFEHSGTTARQLTTTTTVGSTTATATSRFTPAMWLVFGATAYAIISKKIYLM